MRRLSEAVKQIQALGERLCTLWNQRPLVYGALGAIAAAALLLLTDSLWLLLLAVACFGAGLWLLYQHHSIALLPLLCALVLLRGLLLPAFALKESFPPYRAALELRAGLEKNIDILYQSHGGEAKALLLGDREDIDYRTNQAYKGSGLMHLLCVSGLHVGIVCGAMLSLLPGSCKWLRGLLCLGVLLLYTALTGFSSPTMRAAIMLFVLFVMKLSQRQEDRLSALALSLAVLLLLNPSYLGSLGFGLSYASLLGILLLSKPMETHIPLGQQPVMQLLIASLSAGLGALPLFAMLGGYAWVGAFTSLIALPIYPLFLLPGWISILLFPVSEALAKLAALLPRGVLAFIRVLAYEGESLPLPLPVPGALTLVFWFAGLFCLSPYCMPQKKTPPLLPLGVLGVSVLCWVLGL